MLDVIKAYLSAGGIRLLTSAIKAKITKANTLAKITKPNINFPLFLRLLSSDVSAFEQIFINQEYNFDTVRAPKIIVDAGANIGLASIYFSNKFPDAKIIAIEPEKNNFEILKKNIAPYKNILAIRKAVWHENTRINLIDPNLGKWGFMVKPQNSDERTNENILHEVQGITVDTIMKEQGIDHIDILKIDIEGAEREIFKNPSSWIEKVDALIIELHERMKTGCNRSFYNGSNNFDNEWSQGEKVYLTKNRSCIISTGAK